MLSDPPPHEQHDEESWYAQADIGFQEQQALGATLGAREDLKIPDYDLIKRIGSGAYGEVWLAQGVTGALRAVKIVWREDFELTKTFHREFLGIQQFEPISRGHPGLVHVLHVGWNEERGYYYYVMELADDCEEGPHITDVGTYAPRSLSTDLRQHGRLDLHFCQEAGAFMADALHYIHEHGLTHRDIKPSNIIYCGGVCKIADIGLVAISGERSFVGTEGYVPPEGPGTPQADIYSLGKVIYEMSSGKDRMEFPEVPDDLDASELPFWKNINRIICQACAPSLDERFATGQGFAESLRAVTDQRPLTLWGKTTRTLGRAATFFLCSLIAGLTWAGTLHQHHWTYTLAAPVKAPPQVIQPSSGKPWQSSSGLWFSYSKGRHLADGPLDFTRYNQFLEATMSPFEGDIAPLPGPNSRTVSAVVVPEADAEDYCLWLTQRERRAGRLPVNQEIGWEKVKAGSPDTPKEWHAVQLLIERATYGRMLITSTPSPAQVFDGETLLGTTPLTLARVDSGYFQYEVHYPGYKGEVLKGSLKEGEQKNLNVRLKNIQAIVWGKAWKNSLGQELLPLGKAMIGATEVRRKDYAAFLKERKLPALPEQRLEVKEEQDFPITHVTHDEARQYCAWLTEREQGSELLGAEESYRLPMDDEWSMAAGLPRELGASPAASHLRSRGFYPWGFELTVQNANVFDVSAAKAQSQQKSPLGPLDDGYAQLAPVAKFKPSPKGLFDLSGNVWEWVEESYGGEDASHREEGTVRGGSWRTGDMELLLSSYRLPVAKDSRRDDLGFRVLLSRGEPAREVDE
jgi:serine/threonine protein kinase/formylglycine-generating enzyme required for sulfatase activity